MGRATGISSEKRLENYKRQAKADFEKKDAADMEEYRKRPDYYGYEDYSPEGRRAITAHNEQITASGKEDWSPENRKKALDAAQSIVRNKLPALDAETSGYKKGGKITSSASKRADGIAKRGKTRGKMI